MLSYEPLKKLIMEQALKLWPTFVDEIQALPFELVPLIRHELGDYGSEFPLQLGRLVSERPEALATKLIESLPEMLGGMFIQDRGYLNIRLVGPVLDHLVYQDKYEAESLSYSLGVQPCSKILLGIPYLRLTCAALLQARLLSKLGAQPTLYLQEVKIENPFSDQGRKLALDLALEAKASDAQHSFISAFENFIKCQTGEARSCYWLYPPGLPSGEFAKLCEHQPQNVILRGVQRDWLLGFEDYSVPKVQAALAPPHFDASVLYFAGQHRAAELDLAVPTLKEKANLFWYLAVSLGRLKNFERVPVSELFSIRNMALTPEWRRIWVRSIQLHDFNIRAALKAEISDLIACLYQLLDSVNQVMNSPQFRQRLERGCINDFESQLLAGAYAVLSDTMCSEFM